MTTHCNLDGIQKKATESAIHHLYRLATATMSRVPPSISTSRQQQFETFFGSRPENESVDESMSTALISPSHTLQPRAVSFLSPPKTDGLSTVMFRETPSVATTQTRNRTNRPMSSPYEVFFSPASHVSSIQSNSPAVDSTTRNRAKPNPRLERFRQVHISTCQSPRELQQTILDLQSQGNYPWLLKAAQKRLNQVQREATCPLIREEDDCVEIEARISPKSTATSLVYSYDEERDAMSSVISSPAKRTSRSTQRGDATREWALEQEIGKLNNQIKELNQTLNQERQDFECRLGQIQQAKQALVQQAKTLHDSLNISNRTTKELEQQLSEMEDRKREISMQLDAERSARETHQQKAKQVEAVLRNKLQELFSQITFLQQSGGKTQQLNELLKHAQSNLETVKKERNTMIETLLKAMKQHSMNVSKMTQSEREKVVRTFVNQLADRAEKSKSAVQAMQEALALSEADRRKLSQSCRESDIRLQNALVDQQRLEEENLKLTNQVKQLSEDLHRSREQADQLLNKVREENQKEWLKREAMFKNTIRKLQKQLRSERAHSGENKNSGTDAVSKADTTCQALQTVPQKVRVGNTVIRPVSRSSSSDRLQPRAPQVSTQVSSQKIAVLPSSQKGQSNENRHRKSTPASSVAVRGILKPKQVFGSSNLRSKGYLPYEQAKVLVENEPYKENCTQLPVGISASKECTVRPIDAFKGNKTPSKNRAEFVRGNGGLRGLQEKLRQVRSPTFL